MSSRDAWHVTRRGALAGALGLAAGRSRAAELPALLTGRSQFILLEPAPRMEPVILHDLKGRPARIEPPRNGALLLNLWATWCLACREELPDLAKALPVLGRLKVDIVAVSIDAKPAAIAAAYLRDCGGSQLRAFHDPNGLALSAARADGTASPFQPWRMPLTFAVDRVGYVRGYVAGRVDWTSAEGLAFLAALSA